MSRLAIFCVILALAHSELRPIESFRVHQISRMRNHGYELSYADGDAHLKAFADQWLRYETDGGKCTTVCNNPRGCSMVGKRACQVFHCQTVNGCEMVGMCNDTLPCCPGWTRIMGICTPDDLYNDPSYQADLQKLKRVTSVCRKPTC